MDIGGTQGGLLTNHVRIIQSEFKQAAECFHKVGLFVVRFSFSRLLLKCVTTLQLKYDVLDVDEQQFITEYGLFKKVVQDMEHRLASIIIQAGRCLVISCPHVSIHTLQSICGCYTLQAFNDCTTFGATFKLLESFDGLVQREAIKADLECKHSELVYSFVFEMHEACDDCNLKHLYVVPGNSKIAACSLCAGCQHVQ